jgi:hypothetical protein
MQIFFGAAIQGASNRQERADVHRLIINALKANGCEVISEHTTGKDYETYNRQHIKNYFDLSDSVYYESSLITIKEMEAALKKAGTYVGTVAE